MVRHKILLFVAFAVACAVAAVLIFYSYILGGFDSVSADSERLGQFGDYFGGLLNPILAIVNVLLIYYISTSFQEKIEQKNKNENLMELQLKQTMGLHREWTSSEMYGARNTYENTLKDIIEADFNTLSDYIETYEQSCMWKVVSFYQRLGYMVKHNMVNHEMVFELFGEVFYWWWHVSFEKQLVPCGFEASTQVQRLKDWFDSSDNKNLIESWSIKGQLERKDIVALANEPTIHLL